MQPYYQDEAVTIFCGDCHKLLPDIATVDLTLTDPPYGIEYLSGYYQDGNPWSRVIGDTQLPSQLLPILSNKSRKAVLIFARWDMLWRMPPPKSVIVWIKNNWTAGDLQGAYARQWGCILFYPSKNHQFTNGKPADIYQSKRVPPSQLLHPTQKPIDLCQWLIEANTKAGDVILDPFLGSGTTAIAAKALGRHCIGIEIEEKYCEVAARRCSQGVLLTA